MRFQPSFLSRFFSAGVFALAFRFILLSPALAEPASSGSPEHAIRGWYTENGLPSSRVRSVMQDRMGYVWLATAQGIARFDGEQFTVYNPTTREDMATNNFYDLTQTPDGALWFGSNSGLYRLKDGRFKQFGAKFGSPGAYVRTVMTARDGTLIVGTNDGLFTMRDETLVRIEEWKGVTGTIRVMMQKADGSFMFGSTEGLWRTVAGGVEKLSGTSSYPNATYTAVAEERNGRLWIGSNRDLRSVSLDGDVEVFNKARGLTSQSVESLRIDSDGDLWIGTAGGLFRVRNGKAEMANYPNHIGAGLIGQMCEGREGELWVGSNVGLFQLRSTPARAIGFAQGLEQATVISMIETSDGTIWVGLWSGGVYRVVNGRASFVPEFAAVRSTVFYTFFEDHDGALWIGGDAGLFRHADGQFKNYYVGSAAAAPLRRALAKTPEMELPGIVHNRVNSVTSDGAGGQWIATSGALYHRTSDGRFHIIPMTLGMSMRCVIRDGSGELWASSLEHGVMRLHQGQWISYRVADGISSDIARNLYMDSTGAIWLCTSAGLNRFKNDKWRAYSAKDGLTDNAVSSVIEDASGAFWLGTSKGVMRLPANSFDDYDAGRIEQLSAQTFTRIDGLPDSDCNDQGSPAVWLTKSGQILFPTNSGVAVLNADAVRHNRLAPQVMIETLNVGGANIDTTGMVSIAPGSRDIKIHFTATSLRSPEKVRFKAKLSPLDSDWVDLGTRRDIRYPRLPAGEYRLQVIAANDEGIWNEVGATLAFKVRPFFYQTPWFAALAVVAFGGTVFGAFRLRSRHLRQRAADLQHLNEELERRVAERTASLAERSAELARSYDTLRASEYFYHSLVESLPQFIVRKDAKGVYTYANSAFADLHHRPLEEIVGSTDGEIYTAEQAARFRQDDERIMQTRQPIEYEHVIVRDEKNLHLHVKKVPLYDEDNRPIGVQVLFWDMTVFRETEEQLRQTQKELIEASRLAGMAEVATGVLHNIGNVLNSVNTSATLVSTRTRDLKLPSISKVAQLLVDQGDRVGEFFASDPRGQKMPEFLSQLGRHLESERSEILKEVHNLRTSVEHIKEIVSAQQSYARISGVTEIIPPTELIETAIGISEMSLARHSIKVVREFTAVPAIMVERQKAMQILVNLLRNAKDSMNETEGVEKQLTLGLRQSVDGMVEITVTDSGVGIAPENITRIFGFGFTTKRNGHGFGLHSSALAAKELGGSLTAQSAGPGRGATFVFRISPAEKADAVRVVDLPAVDVMVS